MSRARCVSPQNPLILPRGVKPRLSRNATSLPDLPQGAFDAQPHLQRRNLTEQSSESACADMYTPASTMDCEQYQDLSQLSWFESAARPWAAGEGPLSAITQTATDNYSLMQTADSNNILYEDSDYKINDMDNQIYKMSRTDSVEEIKSLAVTAPMEVVPMRLHETLEVRDIVKTENAELDVGREEEIDLGTPYSSTPMTLSQGLKEDPDLNLLLDTPDLLSEFGNRDLIDYLMSDEPVQPVVPSSTLTLPSETPYPQNDRVTPPLETYTPPESQFEPHPSPTPSFESYPPTTPPPRKTTPKLKSTYLAIPREFTTGTSDDNKIPKMLILKTPQSTDLSTINFKDMPPGLSIAERIKTGGKRQRTYTQYSDVTEEEDNDSDYMEESSKRRGKRARKLSMTSVSSSSTDKYRELRDKNNEASRRSRLNRKEKERDLKLTLESTERRNRELRSRSDELEKLVHSLRKILLQIVINSNKR